MLKKQAVTGVKWSAISAGSSSAINFVQTVTLARFLTPADFGLMGMVMIVINLVQMLADYGVSNAIIYRQDASRAQLSSLYWFNMFTGFCAFCLVLLGIPIAAALFNTTALRPLLAWSSLVVLITPLGQQFGILLQKDLSFGRLAMVSIVGNSLNCVVAVALAVGGYGVYSFVFAYIANIVGRTGLLVLVGWRHWKPLPHFSLSDLKGYLSYGSFQMGDKAIGFINGNIVKIFLGSLMGPRALGYYTLAYDHVFKPMSVINTIVNRVAFPTFSRMQDDRPRVRRTYLKLLHVLASVNTPLACALGGLAGIAVPVIYGSQWWPSVILIQILAIAASLQYVNSPLGSLLLAHGKANWLFHWNLGKTLVMIPGMYIGVTLGGAVGAAAGYVILQSLYTSLAYPLLLRRLLGPCLREQIRSVLPSFAIGAVLLAILVIAEVVLKGTAKPTLFATQIAVTLLAYALLMGFMQKTLVKEVREVGFAARTEE